MTTNASMGKNGLSRPRTFELRTSIPNRTMISAPTVAPPRTVVRNARAATAGPKKMPAAKTAYDAHTTASVMNEVPIQRSASPTTGRKRRLAPRPAIPIVASAALSWRRRSGPRSRVRIARSSQPAPRAMAASRAATQPQNSTAPEIGPREKWGGVSAIDVSKCRIVGSANARRAV